MEDRKRPAISDQDDTVPPAKRQALTVNGAKSHADADMPFKDEIELYQKDAILRQMKEYKREKALLESQVADLEKRSAYHDDHLRAIDLWFSQLVDEIKILANDTESLGAPRQLDGEALKDVLFPTTLLASDSGTFEKHLSSRSESIKAALSNLFGKIPVATPDVKALQEELSRKLAAEKEHIAQLHKLTTDMETVNQQLDSATKRYFIAEKKFDRAKSAAVARLEKQAIQGSASTAEDSGSKTDKSAGVNGAIDASSTNEELETARREAAAVAEKRKEHLEKLEAENKKLTEEVTTLNTRLTTMTDDDYAKTDLFKALKSQLEDAVKRLNNLEATHIQVREEVQKFQAERTAYRMQIDEESRTAIGEVEAQLARSETDLTRVRNSRDELLSENSILKSSQEERRTSSEQFKELASARESRIAALETEVERLRTQLGEIAATSDKQAAYDTMSKEELQTKIVSLEKEYSLLSNELPSMEAAWRKAQALASKKVVEVSAWEEQVSRLTAEKSKADQKYFGAMKAKEARELENRTLRAQTAKSAEVLSSLKDSEAASRALAINAEKLYADAKAQLDKLQLDYRALQQKVNEHTITSEGLTAQVAELKKSLAAKDTTVLAATHAQREAEADREKLKVSVEGLKKQVETLKKKTQANQSEEEALLRGMVLCTCCKKNFKDTIIKGCGHFLCKECVDERLTSRSRKCPSCGKSFAASDAMRVHF